MFLRSLFIAAAVLMSGAYAADLPEKFAKRVETADVAYQAAVLKADNARYYALQKANADRVKLLKSALTDATKAGDFDAAAELKLRLTAAESAGFRTKPKNTLKAGTHEYALIPDKVTWYAAKQACEAMGGHLVVLDSPNEQTVLDRLAGDAPYVWLGASDHAKEDLYVWVTGQPVDTKGAELNRDGEGCADVLTYNPKTHSMHDWFSGGRQVYVCEWDN